MIFWRHQQPETLRSCKLTLPSPIGTFSVKCSIFLFKPYNVNRLLCVFHSRGKSIHSATFESNSKPSSKLYSFLNKYMPIKELITQDPCSCPLSPSLEKRAEMPTRVAAGSLRDLRSLNRCEQDWRGTYVASAVETQEGIERKKNLVGVVSFRISAMVIER